MKSFKQYTLLTEATDVSTALETVLGVCYEAASDSKNSATILKKGMKSAEFKKAKKYWQQKGKKPADRQLEIDNLMIKDLLLNNGQIGLERKRKIKHHRRIHLRQILYWVVNNIL